MQLIQRHYLSDLIDILETPDIKIITGVRRRGKSTLLAQLAEHIVKNIPKSNLIHVNYNLLQFQNLRTGQALYDYVQQKYLPGCRNYVLIDEIQECVDFERTVIDWHTTGQYRVVITGSNAFLQQNDLATLFVGRTFDLEVFPFSLSEFHLYFPDLPLQKAFRLYCERGGFAGTYEYRSPQQAHSYVANIFNTLIVRDIVNKHKIKQPELLNKMIDFLADNIGNLTTANKIATKFDSQQLSLDRKTVSAYLDFLCRSFAFYRVRRFDLKGRDFLASQDKYYLVDTSMRQPRVGERFPDFGQIYENMVAIELLRRGFEIYVGFLGSWEVDFVALKNGRRAFIQVTASLESDDTRERELRSLLAIPDGSPKIIIARTFQSPVVWQGVHVVDLAQFLAQPQFLDKLFS